MSATRRPTDRRVAIVHDWLQGYHGSERVVEAIRQALAARGEPPDVFTFHAARELLPPELSAAIARDARVSRLPWLRQVGHDPGRWRYLLPYMPRWFRRLDLDAYDLVISSSHAVAVGVRARSDAVHVCYCHTPMRYAWMPETDRGRVGGVRGLALRLAGRWLRRVDLEASRRPDAYVANSTAVAGRIRRFYGREATVVHPPVDVDELTPRAGESGRFLWVHRLVPYKRPEVVVEAFRGSPHRLTMVGIGPLEAQLRATLPPNVELRGWLGRAELVELYSASAGFIHVAEEDFGISMVEALAAGTPVIALAAGGARDIVRDGIEGRLIADATPAALRDAVDRVADTEFDPTLLAARAAEFSRERFVERLLSCIEEVAGGRRGS